MGNTIDEQNIKTVNKDQLLLFLSLGTLCHCATGTVLSNQHAHPSQGGLMRVDIGWTSNWATKSFTYSHVV